MDKLQTGLATGIAALDKNKPKHPDPALDGKNTLLPLGSTPTAAISSRIKLPTADNVPGGGPAVEVPPICIGTWSWGDHPVWHWDDETQLPLRREALRTLLLDHDHDQGLNLNFIDTAQMYGGGRAEEVVGELLSELFAAGEIQRKDVIVQTKWDVSPTSPNNILHLGAEAPVRALKESLKRLRLEYVDVYLVHGHVHAQSIAAVAEGMARCVSLGLTRAVGVSNYSPDGCRKMQEVLSSHGVPLAVNQCEYGVLRRRPELDGDIAAYRNEMGVVFQAYAPLAQGRLTGKYDSKDNRPPAARRFANYDMEAIEPAVAVLREFAERRGKSGPAPVALNYVLCKGALPVVGVKDAKQARQAAEALGWRLSDEEVVMIDRCSLEGKKTSFWQQG